MQFGKAEDTSVQKFGVIKVFNGFTEVSYAQGQMLLQFKIYIFNYYIFFNVMYSCRLMENLIFSAAIFTVSSVT